MAPHLPLPPLPVQIAADNIYVLMTWCKQTFPGQEEALSGFFKEQGYKETLDYI